MPTPKLQPSRALRLAITNFAEIPTLNVLASGTNTSTGTAVSITPGTGDFIAAGVKPGDIVYNINTPLVPLAATVTAVLSSTAITLNVGIFPAVSSPFIIYQSGANAGVYDACVLYIGTSGTLCAETAGGDQVVFSNAAGGFFPVNVRRILTSIGASTTAASNIIGLW
jgi:hypothetical protein